MNKPKTNYINLVLTLIFIISLLLGRYYIGRNLIKNTELTELSCKFWGGMWRSSGGKLQTLSCHIRFNDVGKACTDGSQCDSKLCATQSDVASATCSSGQQGGCFGLVRNSSVDKICVD